MFRAKTVILCILVTIFSVTSQFFSEAEHKWKTLEKNGLKYKVFGDVVFKIERLSILPKGSITNFDKMAKLLLNHTEISKIEPGAFENLPNLKEIDILGGDLQEIGPGIFNNLNVSDLTIENCNISIIAPDTFHNMTSLKKISLNNNMLKKWDPNWFSRTPNLKLIYANENLLEEIPADAFKGQEDGLRLLLRVSFNNNKIKKIDENAFRGVKYIFYLALSGNQIEILDGSVLRCIQLQFLDISKNKIRCLKEEDLNNIFRATPNVFLPYNTWDPICLKTMKKYAAYHHKML